MGRIRFDRVSKTYRGARVIHDLNLEIEDGEFVVLVGPSGCGKSTTLRMIAGLETVSSGDLWIGERRVNGLDAKYRDVAMVFQSYALYPNMTVRQNLSFGMQVRRESRQRIREEVERVAALLELEAYLDRRPRALSGGQAQRVALGRAMIRAPAAFLFDEPLSNLDAELRVQMRGEISRLQRELGTTTLYVTHDQTEAMTLGHRVAVMRDGKLMQVGPPLELYGDPDNRFVAGFIGSPRMNFIETRVDGDALVAPGGSRVALPASLRAAADGADTVILGVRPERLRLAPSDGDTPGPGAIPGRIALIEAFGHETLIQCETDAGVLLVRCAPEDAFGSAGAAATVRMDEREILLFDSATGRRLRPEEAA